MNYRTIQMQRLFARWPATVLLLVASTWPAIVNHQPFFISDTTAYVREADFAVIRLFGNHFQTSWTQKGSLTRGKSSSLPLNAPSDQSVMAGRSIYYGALVYLGHLTSNFWLTIIVQALSFLYLSYIVVVRCFQLASLTFEIITLTSIVFTPIAFYVCLLMPDAFASYIIVGMVLFTCFWRELLLRDKIFVVALLLLSSMFHASHFILLICLGLILAFTNIAAAPRQIVAFLSMKRTLIFTSIIMAAFLGEVVFFSTTRFLIGVFPIRPPFIMARIIADGPGFRFIQHDCLGSPYVVCRFKDKLPVAAIDFLWSRDPRKGVFATADLTTRKALSSEQYRFFLSVLWFDPKGIALSAIHNFWLQLTEVGIDEFFPSKKQIEGYEQKLPKNYFSTLIHSPIVFDHKILSVGNRIFSTVYFISLSGIILLFMLLLLEGLSDKPLHSQKMLLKVLSISISGVLLNAAICGVLSDPWPRYQSRVAWIPLFFFLLVLAKIKQSRFKNVSPRGNNEIAQQR